MISILGECGSLERMYFGCYSILESMVILKGLIFDKFYFGGLRGLEKTKFGQFLPLGVYGGLEINHLG